MKKLILGLVICGGLKAEELIKIPPINWDKQWKISTIALVAGTTSDAVTSYGMYELNPVLKSQDGKFENKALSIKYALAGATILMEYKMKNHRKICTILNYGSTAMFGITAWHNQKIK